MELYCIDSIHVREVVRRAYVGSRGSCSMVHGRGNGGPENPVMTTSASRCGGAGCSSSCLLGKTEVIKFEPLGCTAISLTPLWPEFELWWPNLGAANRVCTFQGSARMTAVKR